MAINGTITASVPTAYGLPPGVLFNELVLSLPVKANTLVTYGELVCLSTGVVKCTAVTDKVIGMALATVDNTTANAVSPNTGIYGDKFVAVVVKGVIEQDGLTASATYTSIAVGSALRLAAAVSSYNAVAQALSVDTTGSAVLVGKSMDVVTAPATGSQINKVRVACDFTDHAYAWL